MPEDALGPPALLNELSADRVRNAATADLPTMIRLADDERARVAAEWSLAWGNYQARRQALALYFHEDLRMGIQAATMKADTDPVIAELARHSLRLRADRDALDRILRHLASELQIRLASP